MQKCRFKTSWSTSKLKHTPWLVKPEWCMLHYWRIYLIEVREPPALLWILLILIVRFFFLSWISICIQQFCYLWTMSPFPFPPMSDFFSSDSTSQYQPLSKPLNINCISILWRLIRLHLSIRFKLPLGAF